VHRRGSKETRVARWAAIFLAVVWSGWAKVCPVVRAAETASDGVEWNEYVLGEDNGLKAIARVKQMASLADADWLEIEITNNGTAGKIRDYSLKAPATFGTSSTSDMVYGTNVGIASEKPNMRSIGYTIPAGESMTAAPGLRAARIFGATTKDLPVSATLSFSLVLDDGRSVRTPEGGVPITFTWTKPPAARTADLQKELAALLAKTVPEEGTIPAGAGRNKLFSIYLSQAENARLSLLLLMPDVTQVVTLEQALSTLKQCEVDDYLIDRTDGPYGPFMQMVSEQWGHDPALIAFYQEALVSRSSVAIMELCIPMGGVWDDSFIEPLVAGVEARAQPPAKTTTPGRRRPTPRPTYGAAIVFDDDLMLLNRHYSSWAKNPSIATRLSNAVLTAYPALTGNGGTDAQLGSQHLSVAMTQLALTHDRAMIAVLRPFLTNETVSELGILSDHNTPLRVSEIAANSIAELLGEPEPYFGSFSNAGVSDPGPNPVWEEWDKKNAELAKHVEALLKDGKSSGG
jgi:hypothetical protein